MGHGTLLLHVLLLRGSFLDCRMTLGPSLNTATRMIFHEFGVLIEIACLKKLKLEHATKDREIWSYIFIRRASEVVWLDLNLNHPAITQLVMMSARMHICNHCRLFLVTHLRSHFFWAFRLKSYFLINYL